MGWFGKVMGGAIGFAFGGPIGAIGGAALGAIVDSGADTGGAALSGRENAQMAFFVTTFSLLGKLAKADGVVTNHELQAVAGFMDEIGLDEKTRRFAGGVFNSAKKLDAPFEDLARQFYTVSGGDRMRLAIMIDILMRVALADGEYHPEEERMIKRAAALFHFSEDEYSKLKSQYVKDFSRYYAILGCDETDSDETVKKSYRKLARDYHPDKIASKDLPEEFMKFAHNKLQEINEAYAAIKESRGVA